MEGVRADSLFFCIKDFYLLLERGRDGERGREKRRSVASHTSPTGDLAPEPSPQSTEPHQASADSLVSLAKQDFNLRTIGS